MNRVVHFEVAADDPEKTVAFYQEIFDWEVNTWEGPQAYWLVTTGPKNQTGINGAIMPRREGWPRTINTIEVPSVDESVAKVIAAGGEVVVPRMTIPGIGHQAYLQRS